MTLIIGRWFLKLFALLLADPRGEGSPKSNRLLVAVG
jgi:hypothetical protein